MIAAGTLAFFRGLFDDGVRATPSTYATASTGTGYGSNRPTQFPWRQRSGRRFARQRGRRDGSGRRRRQPTATACWEMAAIRSAWRRTRQTHQQKRCVERSTMACGISSRSNSPTAPGRINPITTTASHHWPRLRCCTPAAGLTIRTLRKRWLICATYVPRSTYTASLQTMVFCLADPVEYMPLVMRNAKWLESRQWQKDKQLGMWATSPHGSTDHTDNSMTHFAMLALYEAERVGCRVRPLVWQLALDHWRKTQNEDGSWGWGPNYPGSGSMTCAGIAAITIASGQLDGADATIRGDDVVGCGLQRQDPSLERAFDWLIQGFSVVRNPGTDFWHSYYLYALERAGRMTGQRFIGTHDWYREGARIARRLAGVFRCLAGRRRVSKGRRQKRVDQLLADVPRQGALAGRDGPFEASAGGRLESASGSRSETWSDTSSRLGAEISRTRSST